MNYISNVLYENHSNSVCSLIPFITAGYPSIDITLQVLKELDQQGVDAIELGVPYSDSLADGILIQEASKVAIKNGVTLDTIFYILKNIYGQINAPIIIFSYYNPILARGIKSFISEIADFNVRGLIIPDLPLEEADYIINLCKLSQIELILFISPTSSDDRIANIIKKSPGCLYLVSSTGVTGIRDSIDSNVNKISDEILIHTDKMVMLGFGISEPYQVQKIIKSNTSIHGIVVGSAFTKILSLDNQNRNILQEIRSFCRAMKSATLI
uniref:Tryptophan synthase alpha chain n=1 Tax=Polysiphonia elongata TaxID=159753 RepID=A0A1Z1MBZ4_9FLOR|nr:Tryptophan synthase alpha subunit [Polysiphonia elongata]ARW63264.1 Tryptophan synthase alpha subunit [Polysiphonia elongata]